MSDEPAICIHCNGKDTIELGDTVRRAYQNFTHLCLDCQVKYKKEIDMATVEDVSRWAFGKRESVSNRASVAEDPEGAQERRAQVSDLHLTDDQVAELSEMGIAGEIAADELRLWRKSSARPWRGEIDEIADDLMECTGEHEEGGGEILSWRTRQDPEAIIHSHNTAELRAASVYWTAINESGHDGLGSRGKLMNIEKAYAEIKQ